MGAHPRAGRSSVDPGVQSAPRVPVLLLSVPVFWDPFFEVSHVSSDAVVTCLEGDSLLPPWHPAQLLLREEYQ